MCEQEAAGVGARESLFCSSVSWTSTVFSTETAYTWGGNVWGHADLGSNPASSYFVCGHGLQLISLILSFSVKIRDLMNSQVIGRIKRECEKHLTWCGCIVTISTAKFLSLPLSPDFNSLLSISNSILSLCQFQLVKVNLDSAKRKHTEPRMFPSTLASKMKTWLCLLECAWGNSVLLFSLLSQPLSSLTPFFILTLHQWESF